MKNDKQFAVLGLGRFGRSIVMTLNSHGYDVLACDINPNIVQEMSQYSTHVVQANVKDKAVLESLGLNNFDVVIIAIGEDIESCVLATLIAKELGAKYVIAKAKNNEQKAILTKIGANRVILPEKEMGERLATNLISTNVIDFINLSEKFGIAEIRPIKKWLGATVKDSDIRAEYKLNIVAIKRGNKIIVSPGPNEVIQDEDMLVVIGENTHIQKVSSRGIFGDMFE